ncbi:hypothetical protein [Catenuloplanes atrovinosus]|uniref:Uncharacterized protein n=1 Tax=Catenuloplanes atrovinosus TaxID=137266 RepID=A0AAE3YM18_9ACTN|nr:hypothetical protein [Catenuloplanes atrovinosus]MDR7274982.1 hypothetical protein [Catenuloplanes atrovinosus]
MTTIDDLLPRARTPPHYRELVSDPRADQDVPRELVAGPYPFVRTAVAACPRADARTLAAVTLDGLSDTRSIAGSHAEVAGVRLPGIPRQVGPDVPEAARRSGAHGRTVARRPVPAHRFSPLACADGSRSVRRCLRS